MVVCEGVCGTALRLKVFHASHGKSQHSTILYIQTCSVEDRGGGGSRGSPLVQLEHDAWDLAVPMALLALRPLAFLKVLAVTQRKKKRGELPFLLHFLLLLLFFSLPSTAVLYTSVERGKKRKKDRDTKKFSQEIPVLSHHQTTLRPPHVFSWSPFYG